MVTGRWVRRGLAVACVTVAAATALVVAPERAPVLARANAVAADCDEDRSSTEFGGAAISQQFANLFTTSRSIDHFLTNYVPQGLGVWQDWNGTTEDLFLVGMHHENENENLSLVYGISTTTGAYRGAAYLPTGAHVGGLKVARGYMYVQQNNTTIRRYPLGTLESSLKSSGIQYLGGGTIETVTEVSTFDIDNGYLYGAKYNYDGRDLMRRWSISSTGALVRDYSWGPIEVPKRTQGVLVLSNTWIFSTAGQRNERGNLYVVRRGYSNGEEFTSVRYRCFQGPAMMQELVGYNGRTYLSNESGADAFATGRIHDIDNLLSADTETLRGLVW